MNAKLDLISYGNTELLALSVYLKNVHLHVLSKY